MRALAVALVVLLFFLIIPHRVVVYTEERSVPIVRPIVNTVEVTANWWSIAISDANFNQGIVSVGVAGGNTEIAAIGYALEACAKTGDPNCRTVGNWNRVRHYAAYGINDMGFASWGIGLSPDEALNDCRLRGGFTCQKYW